MLPQSFQILDSADQLSAVKRLIKGMGLDEQRFVPKEVAWFIAGSKEEGRRPPDVDAHDPQTRRQVEIYQVFWQSNVVNTRLAEMQSCADATQQQMGEKS